MAVFPNCTGRSSSTFFFGGRGGQLTEPQAAGVVSRTSRTDAERPGGWSSVSTLREGEDPAVLQAALTSLFGPSSAGEKGPPKEPSIRDFGSVRLLTMEREDPHQEIIEDSISCRLRRGDGVADVLNQIPKGVRDLFLRRGVEKAAVEYVADKRIPDALSLVESFLRDCIYWENDILEKLVEQAMQHCIEPDQIFQILDVIGDRPLYYSGGLSPFGNHRLIDKLLDPLAAYCIQRNRFDDAFSLLKRTQDSNISYGIYQVIASKLMNYYQEDGVINILERHKETLGYKGFYGIFSILTIRKDLTETILEFFKRYLLSAPTEEKRKNEFFIDLIVIAYCDLKKFSEALKFVVEEDWGLEIPLNGICGRNTMLERICREALKADNIRAASECCKFLPRLVKLCHNHQICGVEPV